MISGNRGITWRFFITFSSAAIYVASGCDTLNLPPLGPEEEAIAAAKEPVSRLINEASTDFEALASSGTADPVQAIIDALAGSEGVATVERSIDGSTVIITLSNGEIVSLITDGKDRADWQVASGRSAVADPPAHEAGPRTFHPGLRKTLANAAGADDDFIICEPTSFPQSKKACVVVAFQSQFNLNTDTITEPLSRAGYEVNVMNLATVADIVALRDALSTCGVLYISTHGSVSKTQAGDNANILSTELPLGQGDELRNQLRQLRANFSVDEIKTLLANTSGSGTARWGLTPAFFRSANYPNSLVFIDACQSDTAVGAGGDQLRKAFLDNGAGAFVGWTNSVSARLANPAAAGVFNGLAPEDLGVQSIELVTDPNNPGAGQSYEPLVQLSPPLAAVEVRLHIIGTDGFNRSETKMSDATGFVRFATVPGGAAGVEDTITVVTGGPQNGATVVNVTVQNNPALNGIWKLRWRPDEVEVADLVYSVSVDAHPSFNLACNNPDTTQTQTIIKF